MTLASGLTPSPGLTPSQLGTRSDIDLRTYFSLNVRTRRAEMERWKAHRASDEKVPPPPPPMSGLEQLVMYLGTVVGVVFQPLLQQYRATGGVGFTLPWGPIGISLLIALVVVPIVYEKVGVRRDAPGLVRFGLFAQQGLMWQSLLDAAAVATKLG